MGGWAVYLTLNDEVRGGDGPRIPGSRDIDLGFHLDPKWKPKEFEGSSFGKAIAKIQSMGFEPESFRFVKRYHRSAEAGAYPGRGEASAASMSIFNLYIDVLVDSKDPKRFEVAGFKVLEEPLLARVFSGADYVTTKLEGVSVVMPAPGLLMEMKTKSFPDRTQDDKRTKDLTDLCALLLFSGSKSPVFPKTIGGRKFLDRYARAIAKTKNEEWRIVATSLDITVAAAKRTARLIG